MFFSVLPRLGSSLICATRYSGRCRSARASPQPTIARSPRFGAEAEKGNRSVLVTTSKAPVTTSDAPVTSSFLLLVVMVNMKCRNYIGKPLFKLLTSRMATSTVKRSCPQLSYFLDMFGGICLRSSAGCHCFSKHGERCHTGGNFEQVLNNLLEKSTNADVRVTGTRLRSNNSW